MMLNYFDVGISRLCNAPPDGMPKDTAPPKRKATDKPTPLYDSSTRPFISTRTSAPITTASNVTSRQYTVKSQIIAALPRPLFGDFNEALYARPPDLDDTDLGDMMDIDTGNGLQSELPGIVITKKV